MKSQEIFDVVVSIFKKLGGHGSQENRVQRGNCQMIQ